MKRIKLSAQQATELSEQVNKLTPEQAASALPDGNALEASRVRKKVVKKINQANEVHWGECKRVFDEKTAIVARYEAEYRKQSEELGDGDGKKQLGTDLTAQMRKEMSAVDDTSKASEYADAEIAVDLGNDDYDALRKLYPATVSLWVTPQGASLGDLFVDIGDKIDDAKDI